MRSTKEVESVLEFLKETDTQREKKSDRGRKKKTIANYFTIRENKSNY